MGDDRIDAGYYIWFTMLFIVALSSYLLMTFLTPDHWAWYNKRVDASPFHSWFPDHTTFKLVWPILFILRALALQYAWADNGTIESNAFYGAWVLIWVLGCLNCVLNIVWVYVFFDRRHANLGAIVVLLSWTCSVICVMMAFWGKSYVAASLFIPEPLWLMYATALAVFFAASSYSIDKGEESSTRKRRKEKKKKILTGSSSISVSSDPSSSSPSNIKIVVDKGQEATVSSQVLLSKK